MRQNIVSCFLCLVLVVLTTALPSGYVDEGVVRVSGAVSGTFATDDDGSTIMLIANKEGEVYRILDQDEVDAKSKLVLTLNVCQNGERGVQTVMAHPNFTENKWIYVYYSPWLSKVCDLDLDFNDSGGAYNLLSRFVWSNGKIDPSSEKVLLRSPRTSRNIHNGGAMSFGKDGYLYIAIGDGGSQAPPVSQWDHSILGKMLRVTEDGEIPPTNPYAATGVRCNEMGELNFGQKCQEIFAFGFRNPFRFAMNPNVEETRFMINDVGGKSWEEVSVGGDGYEGANYGWPVREGPCKADSYTSCVPDENYVEPIHWLGHFGEGSAFVGGAFLPDGIWPMPKHSYFFMDFVRHSISLLATKDESEACRDCNPPVSGYYNDTFHDWPRPVDLFFGPYKDTQAMYYIARQGHLPVRRIRYTGTLNRSPVASIFASALEGEHPLTVQFDGTNSTDPDLNEELNYEWDFADGSEPSTELVSSHTFTEKGLYVVKLTVTDKKGLKGLEFVEIMVGKTPIVTMDSPPPGTTFAVEDRFQFLATATDGETGDPIDDSLFDWEMRQHHDLHWHPYLPPTSGNNFTSLPAPSPEDYLAATNSYLEIRLVVTDADGLKTVVSRDIKPRTTYIDLLSEPITEGIQIMVDDYIVMTPGRIVSWENHPLKLSVEPPSNYGFSRWSDGGYIEHSIKVPSPETQRFIPQYTVVLKPRLVPDVVDCRGNPCGECEGHCFTDDDCLGELICYQKGHLTEVPGCAGHDYTLMDRCIQDPYSPTSSPTSHPTFTVPTATPTSAPTKLPEISAYAPIPFLGDIEILDGSGDEEQPTDSSIDDDLTESSTDDDVTESSADDDVTESSGVGSIESSGARMHASFTLLAAVSLSTMAWVLA